MTRWQPGQRQEQIMLEMPYEYVPDHLYSPLVTWTLGCIENPVQLRDLMILLRLQTRGDPTEGHFSYRAALEDLQNYFRQQNTLILDAIEIVLPISALNSKLELEGLLVRGNSAYVLNVDQSGFALRVDPTARDAVAQAIADGRSTSVAVHLTTSWNSAYGRTPDPQKAYSESIKAVEAAAAPVIAPVNLKATLGTLRGELRTNPHLYRSAIEGAGDGNIHTVVQMITALWEGQTSRHGGVLPTKPETAEAAQAAVHLATTLCQWFQSGAISKR